MLDEGRISKSGVKDEKKTEIEKSRIRRTRNKPDEHRSRCENKDNHKKNKKRMKQKAKPENDERRGAKRQTATEIKKRDTNNTQRKKERRQKARTRPKQQNVKPK